MNPDKLLTRRNVLLGGSAACITGIAGYTIFRGGHQEDSNDSEPLTHTTTPTETRDGPITPAIRKPDHPRKKWVTRIPGDDEFYSRMSNPVLDNGSVWTGLYDGTIVRLDQSTGDVTWQYEIEGDKSIDGGPAVADGSVFFGVDTGEKNVYAVDITSNETTWTHSAGIGVLSRPEIYDGTIFVGSIDVYEAKDGPEYTGELVALDMTSGAEVWSVEIEGGVWYSPTRRQEKLYVAGRNEFVALDTDGGDHLWSATLDSPAQSPPHVSEDYVIIQTKQRLRVFDQNTGEEKWSDSLPMSQKAQPTKAGEMVVAAIDAEIIRAYNVATGTPAWEFETDSISTEASLHADASTVYVPAGETLYAVSLSTGERQWTVPLSARAAALAATDSLVIIPQMSSSLITAIEK